MADVPKRQQEPEGDFIGGASQLVRQRVVIQNSDLCTAAYLMLCY